MEERVKELFLKTEIPLGAIATQLGISETQTLRPLLKRLFSPDQWSDRKRRCYANSKRGAKNPSYGLKGEAAHHFKTGEAADGKGYMTVLKPSWYTGRKHTDRVFKHTVILCGALGLTELPAGFVVHHIDGNPLNNDLDNLCLVSLGGHRKIHSRERATTIPEGSSESDFDLACLDRVLERSAQQPLAKAAVDDIVYSSR